jgi:lysyl-tRNA synthetase class 2
MKTSERAHSAARRPARTGLSGLATLRRRIPSFVAFLVFAAGIVDIFSVLTPDIRSRVREVISVLGGSTARSAAALVLVSGLLLVLLSHGLRRRKRRAWQGAVGVLAATCVLNLAKGLDFEEASFALGVLCVLVASRAEFGARSDPRSRWRAPVTFVSLAVVSFFLGELAIQLRSGELVGEHSWQRQVQHVAVGMVGVHGPLHFRHDGTEDLVYRLLVALSALTVLATAYVALRPAEPRAALTVDDEAEVRRLLERFGGRDSLGYFALRGDKAVLWSPSRKAAVAYRVVSGVMLASGDPLGDTEAWTGAIEVFLDRAAAYAWTPAVIGCSEAGGLAWARAGLDALELGDEAIIETADFSLEGRAMRNIRQAVARVERADYVFAVRRIRDIPPAELQEIRRQARAWRGSQTERGFSMALGRFGAARDGQCVAATATRNGQLYGLLHFVPWGDDGLSLDLMIRDTAADNGLNEFLIARLIQHAPGLGVAHVSLNFAVFRSALARGERLGAGFALRAWRGTLLIVSRWFQIESLYRFNAKFHPLWEPRFMCYPAVRDLPRVALAALEAEAFLVWPTPFQGLRGHREQQMINDHDGSPPRWHVATPSGRPKSRLGEYTGRQSRDDQR